MCINFNYIYLLSFISNNNVYATQMFKDTGHHATGNGSCVLKTPVGRLPTVTIGRVSGEGKRLKEFVEWYVEWRAEWHNYAKYDLCGE